MHSKPKTTEGGIVGMVLGSVTDAKGAKLATGLLIGLATGSFLYISLLGIAAVDLTSLTPLLT